MAGEIGAIGQEKPQGQVGGAYMASNINNQDFWMKKQNDNPLSNEKLPGGIFTHPGVC